MICPRVSKVVTLKRMSERDIIVQASIDIYL